MTLPILGLLAGGLVLLVLGAESLVRGASHIAALLGISPLVIGLTVVAFGTSSPEMAVSAMSALNGQADLAVGNVVGSNIFNILFILGLSALIVPLTVNSQLIKIDVPIMVAVSVLALFFAWNGQIDVWEALLCLAGIAGYTVLQIRIAQRERKAIQDEFAAEYGDKPPATPRTWLVNSVLVVVGLVLLVLGSDWLVTGAIALARTLGVSEVVIGLTIVAAGTSLPEVATSVMASIKGERDIAVGNVVGSNIFNILAVFGLAGVLAGGLPVAPSVLAFDLPVMGAVAVACLPIFFSGSTINRWEGGVFLGYYVAYTVYLVLNVQQHDLLPLYSQVMLGFVLPLTVLTLVVVGFRAWKANRS